MLLETTSPLVISMQYVSSFLGGQNERLRLLWQRQGAACYAAWLVACPTQVRLVRRVFLLLAGSLYRRHWLVYQTFPWCLLAFGDRRAPPRALDDLASRFEATNRCCMPDGMAKQMKDGGVSGNALRTDPELRRFINQVGRLVAQQIVDLEWRHGRNRQRSHQHGLTRMATFVAKSVTSEAALLHKSRLEVEAMLQQGAERDRQGVVETGRAAGQEGGDAPQPPEARRLRASTAEELHR